MDVSRRLSLPASPMSAVTIFAYLPPFSPPQPAVAVRR